VISTYINLFCCLPTQQKPDSSVTELVDLVPNSQLATYSFSHTLLAQFAGARSYSFLFPGAVGNMCLIRKMHAG
jgi:hypothetical protein